MLTFERVNHPSYFPPRGRGYRTLAPCASGMLSVVQISSGGNMHFLVISTPRAEKPSAAREGQKQWWDWINALIERGTAKHVYTKLGRGAVIIFDVDSHEM